MRRRSQPRRLLRAPHIVSIALLAALIGPAVALASAPRGSGGVGLGGGTGTTTGTSTTSTTTPAVQNVATPVQVTGDGMTLRTTESGERTRKLVISGTSNSSLPATDAVEIQWRLATRGWKKAGIATVTSSQAFTFGWKVTTSGHVSLRAIVVAVPAGTPAASIKASASAAAATPALAVTIFQPAVATIYGPKFWGHKTACGETLEKTTIGLASRTQKCGSRVQVYYRGHEIVVPVIDRGPYAGDAKWDLTMATAKVLGITETATIGTLG